MSTEVEKDIVDSYERSVERDNPRVKQLKYSIRYLKHLHLQSEYYTSDYDPFRPGVISRLEEELRKELE